MGGREILVHDSLLYCGEGNFLFLRTFFPGFHWGKRPLGENCWHQRPPERSRFPNWFMPLSKSQGPLRASLLTFKIRELDQMILKVNT